MENKLELYLLRKRPEVRIDGHVYPLAPQPLKLLTVIGDKGESVYFRDELSQMLSGGRFREKLYVLRRQLPVGLIESENRDFIQVNRDALWIDSVTFDEQANALLSETLEFTERHFRAAERILSLYEEPFLAQVPTETGNRAFMLWQESRRSELASLYHQLLDRVTHYCLQEPVRWNIAQHYAEMWRLSVGSGMKPIQILLWLAMQQQSDSVSLYLAELKRREHTEEVPLGRAASEWEQILRRGVSLPLHELFGSATQPVPLPNTERADVLEEVLTLLTSLRERQVFGLVGLPGSGKTELARTAAQHLLERNPNAKIVYLELPTQLDWEIVANQLLLAINRSALTRLDYASKRNHLRQMVQMPHLIIIVDEGYSTHLADEEKVKELLELLAGAKVMLVARTLPGHDFYQVNLRGFDKVQVRAFLVNQFSWLSEHNDLLFERLTTLTAGLPLMLNIIASGLKSQRGRVASLLSHLENTINPEADTIFTRYERLLDWLWQYLTTAEKNILFTLSLFAPEVGVTMEALQHVLGRVTKDVPTPGRMRLLAQMRLVNDTQADSSEVRYSLHPIVLAFVERRNLTVSYYASHIKVAFVGYQIENASIHAGDDAYLDTQQSNILQVLKWVLIDDEYHAIQSQAVDLLIQLYVYFEQRGLYGKAFTLYAQVRARFTLSAPRLLQVLFYMGKLAKFQSDHRAALSLFQEAMAIAQREKINARYSSLYLNMGDVHMQLGTYVEALASYQRAEEWADYFPSPLIRYAIWSNIAQYYMVHGQFEAALIYTRKVSKALGDDIMSLPKDLKLIAQHNQSQIGLVLLETSQYEAAKACFQHVLNLTLELNNPEATGYVYLNLGVANVQLKAFSLAYDCFIKARDIAKRIHHPALETDVTWNIAALTAKQNAPMESFRLFRVSLMLIDDYQLKALKLRVLTGMGTAFMRYEYYSMAMECFRQALLLPNASLNHSLKAWIGLVLCHLMQTHLVGNRDIDTAIRAVDAVMQPLENSLLNLFDFAASDIRYALRPAFAAFEHELENLPELGRYRVVEALEHWLLIHMLRAENKTG